MVADFGTNRKRVYDFLLVCNSNLGPISHCFGDNAGFLSSGVTPHIFQPPVLGVFPLHQITHFGVSPSRGLKLFSREIIFEVFQPTMYVITVPERYRETGGQVLVA